MTITLANLEIGTKGIVKTVLGKGAISKRLMEMGIVPGVSIKVVKAAPFGDPIEIRVRGYHLAMRRNEAESVVISEMATEDKVTNT